MKDISTIRRTVATMANQLHRLVYTLSKAFRTAWRRVKDGMTVKAQGVTSHQIEGYAGIIICLLLFVKEKEVKKCRLKKQPYQTALLPKS